MKLRVKLQNQSRVVDLEEREPADVTLSELKHIVASNFELENHDFHLSLNKKDGLPANNEALSSMGIVSGDLLHIIGDNLPQVSPPSTEQHRAQPLGSHSSIGVNDPPSQQTSDVSMTSVTSVTNVSQTEQAGTVTVTGTSVDALVSSEAGQVPEADSDTAQVNRYLLEPLVVRESTAMQVPWLLEQLYCSASCSCAADALWVVIHTLMLEVGFQPVQVSDVTQIPPTWKQSGFYRCSYTLGVPASHTGDCSVVGVLVGSSLIVHGLAGSDSSFKTEQLQLKPLDYVNTLTNSVPEVYVALDRLSRMFKDTICLPLENELTIANGVPSGQGFTSLPYEIKLRILSFLDAPTLCRLAQTRSDMGAVARERVVWRRIYIMEFGKPEDSAVTRNWYKLYREAFLKRKERRDQHRNFMSRLDQDLLFGMPSNLGGRPRPDPRFPPQHIIGGDYDLFPDFAAGGIPNPMGPGHNSRRPGPLLPNMGIPGLRNSSDPFGLPGSARGNLTGSPFSGRGRHPSHSFW